MSEYKYRIMPLEDYLSEYANVTSIEELSIEQIEERLGTIDYLFETLRHESGIDNEEKALKEEFKDLESNYLARLEFDDNEAAEELKSKMLENLEKQTGLLDKFRAWKNENFPEYDDFFNEELTLKALSYDKRKAAAEESARITFERTVSQIEQGNFNEFKKLIEQEIEGIYTGLKSNALKKEEPSSVFLNKTILGAYVISGKALTNQLKKDFGKIFEYFSDDQDILNLLDECILDVYNLNKFYELIDVNDREEPTINFSDISQKLENFTIDLSVQSKKPQKIYHPHDIVSNDLFSVNSKIFEHSKKESLLVKSGQKSEGDPCELTYEYKDYSQKKRKKVASIYVYMDLTNFLSEAMNLTKDDKEVLRALNSIYYECEKMGEYSFTLEDLIKTVNYDFSDKRTYDDDTINKFARIMNKLRAIPFSYDTSTEPLPEEVKKAGPRFHLDGYLTNIESGYAYKKHGTGEKLHTVYYFKSPPIIYSISKLKNQFDTIDVNVLKVGGNNSPIMRQTRQLLLERVQAIKSGKVSNTIKLKTFYEDFDFEGSTGSDLSRKKKKIRDSIVTLLKGWKEISDFGLTDFKLIPQQSEQDQDSFTSIKIYYSNKKDNEEDNKKIGEAHSEVK